MVVVKIELWPLGDEKKAREIGRAEIVNDGTGTTERSNYAVNLLHSGKYYGTPGVWRIGRVEDHRRMLSPYHLVQKALYDALFN